MIKMLRSFFGLQTTTGKRKVVGQPLQVDVKDISYIRESNARLTVLHKLCTRYSGTPQEKKFVAVHDKTKRIHSYLVSKNRLHELELFHVQNTDHFISTYSTIIEVHRRHSTDIPPGPEPVAEPAVPKTPNPQPSFREQAKQAKHEKYVAEMARRVRTQSPPFSSTGIKVEDPVVSVPAVAIDKESSIVYSREYTPRESITKKISFASTEPEKEAFLEHVSTRLGIDKKSLSYAGNAMLALPTRERGTQNGFVPIINWVGFSYALNLTDYRLFPVGISSRENNP